MNDTLMTFIKEKKIMHLIAILIPFFLITGPLLSDLAIIILSFFFIYYCFKKNIFFFRDEKFIFVFFCFFLILIISSIFSDNVIFSLKKSLAYIRFLFFPLAILLLISIKSNFINIFAKCFIGIYFLVLFDGYFQFFFEFNLIGNEVNSITNRLSGFFGEELILGSYLSRLLPLLLFCFFCLKINYKFIFVFLFSSILLILLSGERSAFLLSLLFILYIILQVKEFRISGIVIFFFIFISSILLFQFNENVKKRFNQTITELGFSKIDSPGYIISEKDKNKKIFTNINFFSPMHENYLYTSLQMFKDRPFLGHGPYSYRVKCSVKKYNIDHLSCSTHPHSIYAQLLAETGIIGFIFILAIFIYFIFISIRHFFYSLRSNNVNNKYILSKLKLCLVASFLISLWPFSPSGNFFNNWLSIIYFLPVGFYLSLKYKKQIYD